MLFPVLVAGGVTSPDPNARRVPITSYDQAIADLYPDYLKGAFWAGRQSGGVPGDRITGAGWEGYPAAPTPSDEDLAFPVHVGGHTYNGPSLAITSGKGLREAGVGSAGSSWSVAMVFTAEAASSGPLVFAGASPFGMGAIIGTGGLTVNPLYTSTAMTLPRARVINGAPNMLLACYDGPTRTLAAYLNSLTPMVGVYGPNPAVPPSPPRYTIGGVSAASYRLAQFASFNKSLHTSDPRKAEALVRAAADTYGINLT